jgi:CW-type Zinc Finger
MAEDTWVCCDGCGKWRRIPQTLADGLDENAPWQVIQFPALFTHYAQYKYHNSSDINFLLFSPVSSGTARTALTLFTTIAMFRKNLPTQK